MQCDRWTVEEARIYAAAGQTVTAVSGTVLSPSLWAFSSGSIFLGEAMHSRRKSMGLEGGSPSFGNASAMWLLYGLGQGRLSLWVLVP